MFEVIAFQADELNELCIRHQALMHCEAPRTGERLGVVNGDRDFQSSVIEAAEPFRQLALIADGRALLVQPALVLEAHSLHDERIAFPLTDGVAKPGRLGIVVGKRPAVGEDLPLSVVGFVQDEHQTRRLNDLAGLRMSVELHRIDRQTAGVGMVLAVVRQTVPCAKRRPTAAWAGRRETGTADPETALAR